MKRARLLFIKTIAFTFAFSADLSENHSYLGFSSADSSGNRIISYNAPALELKQIELEGNTFLKPVMENSGTASIIGEPNLPSTSTYYAIAPGMSYSVTVNILSSETIQNVNIQPMGLDLGSSIDTIVKSNQYLLNEFFPEQIVSVSEPLIFRELSMVQVTMTPFQYNPVTKDLIIINHADIELVENGSSDVPFIPEYRSRAFESLYKAMVVNYESLDRTVIEYQRPSILYVLPSNIGNLLSIVQPLMDWKHRVGYEVNYVSSSTVVNNKNNLKNYIENAYETWDNPPEYVTIVGDAEGSYDIPTWFESWSGYNGEGDYPYSLLEGSDQFPEVFLGRISFDTQSDLQTQIGKLLNYESTPYMGDNWFERACLVGDPTTSGISCVISNEHINEMFDLVGFEQVNTIYNGSFANQMTSGISNGVSFFNYRGYWGVSGFGSNNLNQTTNGFMLPVATVITCGTGSFAEEESLTEAFTRAGTVSNPKGSVVCIGTATLGTHTLFNNIVDMGFYYGALIEEIESVGGALAYGKMMLHRNYPSNPNNYANIFSHWNNLIGDGSLQMWTAQPQILSGEHTYAVTKGTNFIDIVMTGPNSSLEDVWVTIVKDGEIFESGYTNYEGKVRLPIVSSEDGEVLLTATKRNYYPYQSSFQIYDPGVSVNINPELIIIDDDSDGSSQGNNNGKANGGEIIELYAGITNYGSVNAGDIIGTLTSENSSVSILSDQVTYGNLIAGESILSSESYIISLDSGLSEGTDLQLSINFHDSSSNSSTGIIPVHVSGNMIVATEIDVIGSAVDVLIPGETSTVKIKLHNSGTTSAENIVGNITSPSPFIEIFDDIGAWTSLPANGTMDNNENSFLIGAIEETIPGAKAYLIVNIEAGDGYTSNSILEIQIGNPTVTDPMGPDDHGYYIYDSGDIGYLLSPSYNWVEVDSRYGGDGTHLNSLSDNGDNGDDVETISLPFNFRMYGVDYSQISICSNGWIAMGETDLESFRNYQIPGVGGPSPMIAAFWDDLKLTNGGRVYTWYDEENHKFYIQWSRVRTFQNSSTENFQVILLNPLYYLTPTGDGEIIIQYEEFNNTSYGSYSSWGAPIHGDYCTVGIEDHTMKIGLQYTFNNIYHPAAMNLTDGTSLLITTRGSEIRLEGDLNVDNTMNIFDILLLIDHILGDNDDVNPYVADINGDSMVNIMDMIRLIQQVMEW